MIKQGTLVVIKTGYWEDFSSYPPVVALVDFEPSEVAAQYVREFEPATEDDQPTGNNFMTWLCLKKFVDTIYSVSWHVGDWHSFIPDEKVFPSVP